jgi:DNA-binding MarR family transcriptional regulator
MPDLPVIDALTHEPARLRVLVLLSLVERADFMYVLRQTGMSRGNLSVQMTRLEGAGLVGVERELDGRRPRTTYTLSEEGRKCLLEYKDTMTRLLALVPDPS